MSIRVSGGGSAPVASVSGATFGYQGGVLALAAGESGNLPIGGIIQNADGAGNVAYDAGAFSGAGGLALHESGVYTVTLLCNVGGSGSGDVAVEIQATPGNGFSDVSGVTLDTPLSVTSMIVVPMLYVTGASTPLDTVTFGITNNTDAAINALLASLQIRRVGGV